VGTFAGGGGGVAVLAPEPPPPQALKASATAIQDNFKVGDMKA
jgi:hypothetical protein